jgi:F-type H+-transporting ATPase subunit epsilon
MLPEHLKLEVVTPARRVLSATVDTIQLPGKNGELGILPGHAPLLTELGIGEMSYRVGGEVRYLTVIDGFAEVLPERVIVLAEVSERAEEIDLARARTAAERAAERLSKAATAPDLDWRRASLALQRALIRQQVATKGGEGASNLPSR